MKTRLVSAHKIHTIDKAPYNTYTIYERADGTCVVSQTSHTGSFQDNNESFDPPFKTLDEAVAWIESRMTFEKKINIWTSVPARPWHAKGYGKR